MDAADDVVISHYVVFAMLAMQHLLIVAWILKM